MASIKQKIFKSKFVDELRSKVLSGESLCDYYLKSVEYPADAILEIPTLEVDEEKLVLPYSNNEAPVTDDLAHGIAIYDAYPNLNETQASDPRLWSYLTHVTFREYVQARWPLAGTCEQTKQDEEKRTKAVNSIIEHWFASSNDRLLRRNALARLWWVVHLTRAPWESEPEFFKDLKNADPYRFTKRLLSTQDIYSQFLERGLGRDSRLLITILEFLEIHDLTNRIYVRPFAKDLNLAMSVSNFSVLSRKEMKQAVFQIGERHLPNKGSNKEMGKGDRHH